MKARVRAVLVGAPLVAAGLVLASAIVPLHAAGPAGQSPAPAAPLLAPPIDPQHVQDQDTMTWADYHPIPGHDWADAAHVGTRTLRVALIAVDFDDQPFVITQPKQSDPFGNPQIDPVRREQVPQFYADFFGKPNAVNHGHTINGYWMEQSRGRIGIPKIDVFGPYRMPKKLFQYGLNEWGQGGGCPKSYTCDGRLEPDADALWAAAAGRDIKSKYDIVLRIYGGYDETSVWQEFGEMKFQTKEDIPAEWGNTVDPSMPRWVATRYVPWTSWKAGQMQWGISSVRQGENSGTITHEIAHHAFRVGDNNNNPYVKPYRRAGSGTWDIMDRGSFNGPGGPHHRYVVPPTQGASMPAGFMLRNRIKFNFVEPGQVLALSRNGLAASGLAVATITARAVDPGQGGLAGVTVALDGTEHDRTPACDMSTDPLCAGKPVFDFYSVEVVQRIGYDSFTPDNGVLIAKNKNGEDESCGYGCFTWVIDAHPEDINVLDFKRPDGTPVMRTIADYRQLNDALFHAGLGSGSQYEWEDTPNRLHFYVIGLGHDASGILSYTVGVRSLDGAGPHVRGVALTTPAEGRLTKADGAFEVTLRNTGKMAAVPASSHPQDVTAWVGGDIYRLSVTVDGKGWSAGLQNALAAVKAGATATVPVFVRSTSSGAPSAKITLKAVSESDPTKTATASWVVNAPATR